MQLSPDFIEELKRRNDIESIVSSYVSLKHRGRNAVGLCPFHSEKTGSFVLYPETESYARKVQRNYEIYNKLYY